MYGSKSRNEPKATFHGCPRRVKEAGLCGVGNDTNTGGSATEDQPAELTRNTTLISYINMMIGAMVLRAPIGSRSEMFKLLRSWVGRALSKENYSQVLLCFLAGKVGCEATSCNYLKYL